MFAATRLLRAAQPAVRHMSSSAAVRATSALNMPAMSPTMTEGTLTEWKVKVGDAFAAGDVLCQIETDKASIDVEAQDDGVLGKIIETTQAFSCQSELIKHHNVMQVENGSANVQVGSLIALLAEEGDDISNIQAPEQSTSNAPASTPAEGKESELKHNSSSYPTPAATKADSPAKNSSEQSASPANNHAHAHPTHSHALLPSVLRLLMLEGISDTSAIKATGPRGHLTKGDVLAHLGRIKSATGSEKPDAPVSHSGYGSSGKADGAGKEKAEAPKKEMTALEFRQLIASGLGQAIAPAAAKPVAAGISFDSVLDEYFPAAKRSSAKNTAQKAAETVAVSGPKKVTFDSILDL